MSSSTGTIEKKLRDPWKAQYLKQRRSLEMGSTTGSRPSVSVTCRGGSKIGDEVANLSAIQGTPESELIGADTELPTGVTPAVEMPMNLEEASVPKNPRVRDDSTQESLESSGSPVDTDSGADETGGVEVEVDLLSDLG